MLQEENHRNIINDMVRKRGSIVPIIGEDTVVYRNPDTTEEIPFQEFIVQQFRNEPTLKSKACLKCLYFTIIIFDLCRYLEYFSYLCTINQTE